MAEITPGVSTPVEPAPGATNPVTPPPIPAGEGQGQQPVQTPKVFTEEEHRKGISERLSKERKRLERTVRAEVERDYYRSLAETRPTQQPAQDKPKGRPQAKDFQSVEEFLDADYTWRRDREKEAEARERKEREPKDQAKKSAEEYSRSLQDKLGDDGSGKYKDFEDVVFSEDVPFTDPMVAAIHESVNPRDLAYYLATHLSDLQRIAKLPSTRQVIELGKIEDKLAAPPKPTGAPPPIVPNGGNSAGVKKDYSQMNTAEHIKAYRNRDKTA